MYGHGVFVYEPVAALKKYRTWDGVASALLKMKMTHAWVRGHGKDGLFEVKDNLGLIGALRKAGIKVFIWGWCQGEGQLDKDIENAADAIAKFSPDGYVADIEQGVSGAEWTQKGIKKFLAATRTELGGKPLILSTHGFIPYHEPELMQAADPFVDAFAPQVYWFWFPSKRMFSEPGAKGPYKTNNAAAYADLCLDVWRHITDKPIVITGQAYWGEIQSWTRQDAEKKLQEFATGFNRYGEIAGLNWWYLAGSAAMSPAMETLIAAADFQARLDAAPVTEEGASAPVRAMLEELDGETRPLAVIAPLSDTASVLSDVKPRIIATAKASAIARYDWKNRGPACIGYSAGMAVAYGAAYARLQAHDPVADRMSRALEPAFRNTHGLLKGDALTWYDDQFKAISMGAATPVERLRRLFVLLLGLGMRESSGRYCEGRDQSANNTAADTAEAGLFQMSFDLVAPRAELLDVFHHYQSNSDEGLREIFEEEMSPPPRQKDLKNFGPSGSPGFAFQKLSKECPAMTVEIAALGLREEAGHWGPIITHAAEVRSASKELLLAVERIVDAPTTAAATQGVAQPMGGSRDRGRPQPRGCRPALYAARGFGQSAAHQQESLERHRANDDLAARLSAHAADDRGAERAGIGPRQAQPRHRANVTAVPSARPGAGNYRPEGRAGPSIRSRAGPRECVVDRGDAQRAHAQTDRWLRQQKDLQSRLGHGRRLQHRRL